MPDIYLVLGSGGVVVVAGGFLSYLYWLIGLTTHSLNSFHSFQLRDLLVVELCTLKQSPHGIDFLGISDSLEMVLLALRVAIRGHRAV